MALHAGTLSPTRDNIGQPPVYPEAGLLLIGVVMIGAAAVLWYIFL